MEEDDVHNLFITQEVSKNVDLGDFQEESDLELFDYGDGLKVMGR